MRARDLPLDILLDSLVHLTPMEVDCRLRFVCRRYNALVEQFGATLFSKHSISIYRTPPPDGIRHAKYPELGWFSFDGGQRQAGFDRVTLQALLRSNRLERISLVQIKQNSWRARALAKLLRRKFRGIPVDKLHLSGVCEEFSWPLVERLKPTCLELSDSASNIFRSSTTFCKHYFRSIGTSHLIITGLHSGQRLIDMMETSALDGCSVVCHTDCWGYYYMSDVRAIVLSYIRGIARVEWLHFPRSVLIFSSNSKIQRFNVENESVLGEPDEPLRRVDKLVLAYPTRHDQYHTSLENCEWRVWRVRNPSLKTHEGGWAGKSHSSSKDGSIGGGGGGGKYLRVMEKVGGNASVTLAIYLKVFDESERDNEGDI